MTEKSVVERLDSNISVLRYKSLCLERLSRLTELTEFYEKSSESLNSEQFVSKMSTVEQLSDKFELPLLVHGVFLSEGQPYKKWYSGEELRKAADNPVNQSFPLMLDHKHTEAAYIVGKVTKISYDPNIRALRWWGHINDETHARNVLDGVVSEVSVTVYAEDVRDGTGQIHGTNLTFGELSLVRKGRDKKNSIEVTR